MNHLLLFLLTTVVASLPGVLATDWDDFKNIYGKEYQDAQQELERKLNFESELLYVAQHNALFDQGLASFKIGINNFSDWTQQELSSQYLMTDFYDNDQESSSSPALSRSPDLPPSLDWRDQGIVTGIKNQGSCGSCWAFAAVGAMEAVWAKQTGQLSSMSEQELIDCGVGDCGGGWSYKGFQTVIDMGGIMAEDAYPYTGTDQGQCRYQDSMSVARISSYEHVPALKEQTMAGDLFENSPIAVSIDASLHSFHAYTEGIYYDPDCSTSKTNHIVLVVGYNMEAEDREEHYWIVKNSWGAGWGMDGYIHMRMWVNNCNIARWGYYPIL